MTCNSSSLQNPQGIKIRDVRGVTHILMKNTLKQPPEARKRTPRHRDVPKQPPQAQANPSYKIPDLHSANLSISKDQECFEPKPLCNISTHRKKMQHECIVC